MASAASKQIQGFSREFCETTDISMQILIVLRIKACVYLIVNLISPYRVHSVSLPDNSKSFLGI